MMFDPVSIALSFASKLIGFAQKRDSERTRRFEIETGLKMEEVRANVQDNKTAASVVKKAMDFKWFWIPWLIATVPLASWFGWGMLDSLFNGALPDVAQLPPQLQRYADVAWSNLFYGGSIMGGSQVIAKAVTMRLGR